MLCVGEVAVAGRELIGDESVNFTVVADWPIDPAALLFWFSSSAALACRGFCVLCLAFLLSFGQAAVAGRELKKLIGDESVNFIVSPYTRTRMTYEIVRKELGCTQFAMKEDPRLRGNFKNEERVWW